MKNIKLLPILLLSLVLISPINAKADNDLDNRRPRIETPRKIQLNKQLLKGAVEDRRERLQEAREAYKNSEGEERNVLRREFRNRFLERFDFTITKMMDLSERLSMKLEEMNQEGKDTTEAESYLNETNSKLEEAKNKLESLREILNTEYSEEDGATKREEVKSLVEGIKEDIKSAHESMRKTLKAIKDLRLQDDNNEEEIEGSENEEDDSNDDN